MNDVTLVTCAAFPDLAPDDQLLREALQARGASVRAAVWNDPAVDWAQSPVAVVRSTWDYFDHPEPLFRAFIETTGARTRLFNPPRVLQWNMHKRYLLELARRGVPAVPTLLLERGGSIDLPRALSSAGFSQLVVKPAIAGSSRGARRFGGQAAPLAEAPAHARALLASGDVLVQPYLAEVETERERSLVFLAGHYSHAVLRAPFNAGASGGQSAEVAHAATPRELAAAAKVLAATGEELLYARVDLVPAAGDFLLMELEVIEPALFFRRAPGSAERLAAAILERCRS